MVQKKRASYRLVASLAVADLRHEIILTGCIVLALTAIIAPLLLLLGLKHGVIENQLERLIEDPVYREVRPEQTQQLPPEWFQQMRARPDVAFLVPSILRGASQVAAVGDSGRREFLDIVPTIAGDPLLLENNAVPPEEGELVLSSEAAARLGTSIGDTVALEVSRGGTPLRLELTVTGVMGPRADPLARVYATFAFVEDVETWRSGSPVPTRGWDGEIPKPFETYDGIIGFADEPFDPRARRLLTSRTGVSEVTDIDAARAAEILGVPVRTDAAIHELRPRNASLQAANFGAVRNATRGTGALMMPVADPVEVSLDHGTGQIDTTLWGLDASDSESARYRFPSLPWLRNVDRRAAHDQMAQVLVPAAWGLEDGSAMELSVTFPTYAIAVPVKVAGSWDGAHLLAPMTFAAMLRTGAENRIAFLPEEQSLALTKEGYRGFRLYARSIDDVAGLNAWFLGQGIPVVTQAGDIDRVKRMDRALTQIFLFVSVIGLSGGVMAMMASLYASVERKRREIGIMRLLGIPRAAILGFPLTQSVLIGVIAAFVAVVVFLIVSRIMNTYFAADLPVGDQLAFLPPPYFFYTLLISGSVCAASSIVASVRATRIEPAEAIREE